MEKSFNNVLKSILPSLVVFALQFVISGIGTYVIFCKTAYEYQSGGYNSFMKDYMNAVMNADFNSVIMLLYSVVGVLLFAIWYNRVFVAKEKKMPVIKKLTKRPVAFAAGVVAFGLGMQYLCIYLMNVLSVLFPEWLAHYEKLLENIGLTDKITLPLLIYTVFLGPVCEELTFRGLTMGYAKKYSGFWTANVIQALLFAGMHMNAMQGTYAFFLGLFLGYFVNKSGTIWMGVILHIVFNAFGVLGNPPFAENSSPMIVFAILFSAMTVCYGGFLLIDKNIPQEANEKSDDNGFRTPPQES